MATRIHTNKQIVRPALLPSALVSLGSLLYLIVKAQASFGDVAGRLAVSRLLLGWIALQLALGAVLFRPAVAKLVRDFFAASAPPLNLAVFRIVFFLLLLSYVDLSSLVWFSQIPPELRVFPRGAEWLAPILPINETWARTSGILLAIFCVTATLGLYTRVSAALCFVFGLYVLGLPQFFGKVNHNHHMLWFTAILATSRCGDMLSLDAILAARRRADQGSTEPPAASRRYALPLRCIWLLIGVCYFFPGFWKFWAVGIDWAMSDNLRNQMYTKWLEIGGWTPIFRIDHYPLFYKLSAFGTIVFELSFIFLIFVPRLRILAVLGGLMLHSMIRIFMRISFLSLSVSYVAFVDWQMVFRRVGRRLLAEDFYLLFDGDSRLCRRIVAAVRTLDIFGRVTYVSTGDQAALEQVRLIQDDLLRQRHPIQAVSGRHIYTGSAAFRALARRVPLLWPLLIVLLLPRMRKALHAPGPRPASDGVAARDYGPRTSASKLGRAGLQLWSLVAVSTFLIAINGLAGARGAVAAWPFASYPTFAELTPPERRSLALVAYDAASQVVPVDQEPVRRRMTLPRYQGVIDRIVQADDPEQQRVLAGGLWKLIASNAPNVEHVRFIRVYRVSLSTLPERRQDNLISQDLLVELDLDQLASSH
jgi:predicted DCC family thiol-disulfide oxidoreductase YuxK